MQNIIYKTFQLMVLSLSCTVLAAQAQTLSDYSVLPETMSVTSVNPDILVIFDNSTSMRRSIGGQGLNGQATNPLSRSYIARTAMQSVLDGLEGRVNLGLMAYQTKNPPGSDPDNPLRGGGALHHKVAPLTGAHLSNIKNALLTEDIAVADTILSVDHTSMEGSLRHAHEYFKGSLTGTEETLQLDTIVNTDGIVVTLNETGLPLADIYDNAQLCAAYGSVILVTDGQASSHPTDPRHVNSCLSGSNTTCSIDAAADMLAADNIKTYVIGFADASLEPNLDSLAAAGGTTDSYFATNESELIDAFTAIISDIIPESGSSSGLSVVASSSDAAGSVVQAIYSPEIIGTDPMDSTSTVSIYWTSTLSAYFIDQYGYLREDNPSSGTPGKLDASYAVDYAFKLALEDVVINGETVEEVRAKRITPTGIGTPAFTEVVGMQDIELEDLNPVWEAGKELGRFYDPNATAAERATVAGIYGTRNRPYNDVASASAGYRRIYSWIKTNPSSTSSTELDAGAQIEFIYDAAASPAAATINANNYTLLGTADATLAENIVRFTRGQEDIAGFRSRTTAEQSYLLGDIVHSSAAQVDSPGNVFNTRVNDDSYSAFQAAYADRRRMVYVGGNDGLIHAFNGGFWDGETRQFNLVAPNGGADDTAHELGAEIWAYAPMNLLPHLQWLTSTGYNANVHVAYVDGPIKIFDVRAFAADSVHVNGWGTILVAAMRFGGGEFEIVDPDGAGGASSFTARSAYVIIDVTDPSQEPVVIGEITHENLGFTSSEPTVMKEGDDWFLMFGSGPNDLATATSIGAVNPGGILLPRLPREPQLFRYKLNAGSRGFATDGNGDDTIGSVTGFVGDLIARDWNADYSHDAVYFGVISGDEADPSGGLYRYVSGAALAGSSKIEALLDVGQPVVDKPLLKNSAGKNWAFFGTGRYLTAKDAENDDQNSFYGVIEPRGNYDEVTFSAASIIDVTDVNVSAEIIDPVSGLVTQVGGVLNPPVAGKTTFSELRSHILSDPNVNGWRYNFDSTAPTEKNTAPPLSFKSLLFYTYYKPVVTNGAQCDLKIGESFLNVVDLVTGTASFTRDFEGPLGLNGVNVKKSTSIGDGYASDSYLFIGPDPESGKSRILIKTPLSTGAITDTAIKIPPSPNGRTSWRELEVQ